MVCLNGGYQISIRGAAEMDVCETELIAQVAHWEIVIKAITQTYGENAKCLNRIEKWMGKVGLDWIRAQTFHDPENRAALVARFEICKSIYRTDPWAEIATQKAERYQPLATLSLEAAE